MKDYFDELDELNELAITALVCCGAFVVISIAVVIGICIFTGVIEF